ncbi:MAG: PHP domain-containing protein [Verrucomicrobiia bacterium]
MKRILIFTAGFGEGHNTAARNIRDAIEHIAPDEAKVEILDLFDECYGRLNDLVRKAYITTINKAPRVWGSIYDFLDQTQAVEANMSLLARMRRALADILQKVEPDAVVSTYPLYNFLIDEIFGEGDERPFSQITVVTDSVTINSVWYRGRSDYYLVANEPTSEALQRGGIEEDKIRNFGFPVTHRFADGRLQALRQAPKPGGPHRVLYIINSGKKEAPKVIRRLAKIENVEATVTVGRDAALKDRIQRVVIESGLKATVLGWSTKVPELLCSHHVVISKAGGATVQEAIAARCPMIISQVVPGQEEGNARLLLERDASVLATDAEAIARQVEELFSDGCSGWSRLHEHISALSRPAASLDIARFILEQSVPGNTPTRKLASFDSKPPSVTSSEKSSLLCDLHTHTVFSDGQLTVGELVDFYGQRGFDALCITDHFCDPEKLLGKLVNLSGLVLLPEQVEEYFETIEREKKRAWTKYGLLLMAGLEFNKDGLRKRSSAHLLGIDLVAPISPSLSIVETISAIHDQGALAVAAHPHEFKTAWGKDTLHFWENIDTYAPLLDAWEVANRDDIFNPIGLKRLPILANSDFHKPKHIYSWKTVLHCAKDPEAIKQCIRINRDLAITLYRDYRSGFGFGTDEQPANAAFSKPSPALTAPLPAAARRVI